MAFTRTQEIADGTGYTIRHKTRARSFVKQGLISGSRFCLFTVAYFLKLV